MLSTRCGCSKRAASPPPLGLKLLLRPLIVDELLAGGVETHPRVKFSSSFLETTFVEVLVSVFLGGVSAW